MSGRRGILGVILPLLVACTAREPSDATTKTDPTRGDEDPKCAHTLTEYVGDCQAPPAVDPSVGVLAHYGPRNYDDPDDVKQYVMSPGYEGVDCVYSTLPNDTDLYYQRYSVWSRPGTHHVILGALTNPVADGKHDVCEERNNGSTMLAVVQGGIGGAMYRYPPGEVAPENEGLATKLAPHQGISYELHAVNSSEGPLLRENWTIFYAMPPGDVKDTVGQMAFNGGLNMNVQPHSKQTVTNSCPVSTALGPVRVVDMFAHMHAHGKRFSAWVSRADAVDAGATDAAVDPTRTRTLIYESYDWSELDLIEFSTVRENPSIGYQGGIRGGVSGDLYLSPGDRIEYECAIDNDGEFPLTFRAKAFEGEMCNMFGSFTPGVSWQCLGK